MGIVPGGGSGGGGLSTASAAWYGSANPATDVEVINANTTLTSDLMTGTLTITNGATLFPDGFRVIVSGTLTIEAGCSISAAGNAAVGAVGGLITPTNPPLTSLQGEGSAGGVGAVAVGVPTPGTTRGVFYAGATGGAGGAGGAGSSKAGAAGGDQTTGLFAVTVGEVMTVPRLLGSAFFVDAALALVSLLGGGGGGGGGNNNILNGGGGGGGGGVLLIAAQTLQNDGVITAKGGDGGNASGGNSGGGGGGGGGLIITISSSYFGSGTVDVSGGAGGLRSGTGVNGNPGASGRWVAMTA